MTRTEEKLASLCVDEIKRYSDLLVEQRDELLEALEKITSSDRAIHLREEDYFQAIQAIKKAKGE